MNGDTHAQQRDDFGDDRGATGSGGPGAQYDGYEHGQQAWQRRRDNRIAAVTAPYGPLSVTGTHWVESAETGHSRAGDPLTGTRWAEDTGAEHGRIDGVPGKWTVPPDGGSVVLEAHITDGIAVDGDLLVGEVELGEDGGPPEASRVSYGERRLVLMRREGAWAVRVFDPDSAARRAFTGIDVHPYDPGLSLSGTFRPYDGERRVRVGNADGQERGLGLDGELGFAGPDGAEHVLGVSRVGDGGLWAVFADGTSGVTSYRFRFLYTEPPAAYGAVTVDFNSAVLPPCAFTEHFLCPLPPPGNTLPFEVPAGERNLSGH